jgi:hypothetical protein
MAAVPPRGLVEQDGGGATTKIGRTRWRIWKDRHTPGMGPVEFDNGCHALTDINLARSFGSGKGYKGVVVGA